MGGSNATLEKLSGTAATASRPRPGEEPAHSQAGSRPWAGPACRPVPPEPPARRRLLINGEYALLWWSQAVSSIGDSVFATTLVLWTGEVLAAGQPWAPAAVSGILVSAGLAYALAGIVAGTCADRLDRRKLMAATESARAVITAVITALSFLPSGTLPAGAWLAIVYSGVFLLTAAGQFFRPARLSVIRETVQEAEDRTRAFGVTDAMATGAGLLGPPVAAPLLFAAGVHWALAANAVSYVVSFLAVRALRPRPRPRRAAGRQSSLRGETAEGLRMFGRSRYLTSLLTVTVTCQAGTAAITALGVFFVTGDLHAPASRFGIVETLMGAGFIAGAVAAARLLGRIGPRTLTGAGLLAAGIMAAACALQRIFPAGAALAACYYAMIGLLDTATRPMLMRAVPEDCLGRLTAVFDSANQCASAAAVIMWGLLASTALRTFHADLAGISINAASLIFIIGAAVIAVSGVCALTLLPDLPPPGPGDAGIVPPDAPERVPAAAEPSARNGEPVKRERPEA